MDPIAHQVRLGRGQRLHENSDLASIWRPPRAARISGKSGQTFYAPRANVVDVQADFSVVGLVDQESKMDSVGSPGKPVFVVRDTHSNGFGRGSMCTRNKETILIPVV